jgi:hypothetical protein
VVRADSTSIPAHNPSVAPCTHAPSVPLPARVYARRCRLYVVDHVRVGAEGHDGRLEKLGLGNGLWGLVGACARAVGGEAVGEGVGDRLVTTALDTVTLYPAAVSADCKGAAFPASAALSIAGSLCAARIVKVRLADLLLACMEL